MIGQSDTSSQTSRRSDIPFHLVLYQPQIPQNTGSIARTCAATGVMLHLVGPLGFVIDDRRVRRAGLDYWPHVKKRQYDSWEDWCEQAPSLGITRVHAFSKRARGDYWKAQFTAGDALLFGREDKGLPPDLSFPPGITASWQRVPIRMEHVRSLNLSVCTGIALFEAFRQSGLSPDLVSTVPDFSEISDNA